MASRVAISEADTPEKKTYLDRLVALMDLSQDSLTQLDYQISAVRTAMAMS